MSDCCFVEHEVHKFGHDYAPRESRIDDDARKALPAVLSLQDIAKHFRVSRNRVALWIRTGQLQAVKIAGGTKRPRFRIRAADLERFMVAREFTPRGRPRHR